MAAKKKGGKAKKDTGDPPDFDAKENLKRAEAEISSLQRQLDVSAQEMQYAREHEREWRERLDAFGVAMEKQRENTLDIMSDMSRQFKAMQEQLLQKIDTLEMKNHALTEQLEARDNEVERLRAEYSAIIAGKDAEIKELHHKADVMSQEFSDMLKETLDKMSEHLDNVGAPAQ